MPFPWGTPPLPLLHNQPLCALALSFPPKPSPLCLIPAPASCLRTFPQGGEHVPGEVGSQGWDLPSIPGASSPFPTGHWPTQDISFWSPAARGQGRYRTFAPSQNVLWTALEAKQIRYPQEPANRVAVLRSLVLSTTEAHGCSDPGLSIYLHLALFKLMRWSPHIAC